LLINNCEERTSQDNTRGRHLDIVVNQFKNNCEERTSQVIERVRPLNIVDDLFKNNCVEMTSQVSQRGGLLISHSTSFQTTVKKGRHKFLKEEGLLIS
jgi:hypothetical protein